MWDQDYKRRKPVQEIAPSKPKKLDIEIPDIRKAVAGIDSAMPQKLGPPPTLHPVMIVMKYRLGGTLTREEDLVIRAMSGGRLSAEERSWAVEHLCTCFGE